MGAMRLTGYADKFGVHPGETIRFYRELRWSAEYQGRDREDDQRRHQPAGSRLDREGDQGELQR